MNNWKTLSSTIVYQNQWMTIHEDQVVRPDGEKGIYSFVETPPSVMVVPFDEDGYTYLVGLNRYVSKAFSWEVAGGRSDGDDLHIAANRELTEELGFIANKLQLVGSFQPMNGISSETSYVFIARNLRRDHHDQAEEGIIKVKKIKIENVFPMIQRGELTDGQSISALFLVAQSLGYTFSC